MEKVIDYLWITLELHLRKTSKLLILVNNLTVSFYDYLNYLFSDPKLLSTNALFLPARRGGAGEPRHGSERSLATGPAWLGEVIGQTRADAIYAASDQPTTVGAGDGALWRRD